MTRHRNPPAVPGRKRRAIAGAVSAAVAGCAVGNAQAEDTGGIEEVIVSARKRDENIQDIPQAVLSFGMEEIGKQGIASLEDVAKFAPSMTVVGSSAGLNKIVFRGLADSSRPYIADSSAAIYLDEQPLTTGAQSPEIRPVDLERIEVLAGPQGTLYGASSQSGTVRYIVNKPDVGAFAADVGGGTHAIDGGDVGWDADLMLNIPLVPDKLAVRLVGFAAKDAGYIDNVLGATPYAGTGDNAAQVEDDVNSADWAGGRVSVKWLLNDAWSVTGIYNRSKSKIKGFNDYDPTRGDLETVKFTPETWDDDWRNGQFTLEGELGFARLSSSTSYFERDTAYVFDNTNGVAYYHSVLGMYGRGNCGVDMPAYNIYDFSTACGLNGAGVDIDDADPTGYATNDQRDTRWTHETRLTGSGSRLDWTLGFFHQEARQHWEYGGHVNGLMQTEAWAAHEALNGGPLPPTDVNYASGEKNERKDTSVFGEATVGLTAHWKLLAGARWYKASMDRRFHITLPGTGTPDASRTKGSEDGLLPKIGLQYVIDDDRMLYALYSEGFRLGGVNRDRAQARGLVPTFPSEYDSDVLENWEAGLKSQWLDGSLQVNVTAYHQIWRDMQLELSDPQAGDQFFLEDTDGDGVIDGNDDPTRYPYQTVIANLGDAVVDGFDLDLTLKLGSRWTLGLVSTYLMKAELDDDIRVSSPTDPSDVSFELAAGTRLPLTADLNAAAYVEYSWPLGLLGGGDAWIRLQYSYTGGSHNRLQDNDGLPHRTGYGGRAFQPESEVWDLRAGYDTPEWELSLYVDNLGDERINGFENTGVDLFWGHRNVRTSDPRSAGLSVRRHFK